ncbi:hypothetical protein [Flagellimonas sp.]|uniref:hypothetical protein n=1 Tax=Flagellimonas sp. TaxID=2058762 RepID=UPI003BAC0925
MKKNLFLSFLTIIFLSSCDKNDNTGTPLQKESISGAVQKGPFINGTNIVISELENDLSQTGSTYNTQITNNQGGFEVKNVNLASNFVQLSASGFYFNETSGKQSTSQITLNALSDVSDKSTINVNILSQLEMERVKFLITSGMSFNEAKLQAQNEIFDIFNFSSDGTMASELLDISQVGENNAMLLAASLILQGYRSEAETTELISNISIDLKEDGILNNAQSGSKLINHVPYLDLAGIRQNLEVRYNELGVDANIPNFEKYINEFIENTSFEITETLIDYPTNTIVAPSNSNAINILDLGKTVYSSQDDMSLTAKLKKDGASVKIKITALQGGFPNIFTYPNELNDWITDGYDNETFSQTFTTKASGENCNIWFQIITPGDYLIEYFEMSSFITPTKTKTITITE